MIGKIAATVEFLQKERDHCCVTCHFNLSSVSHISIRPEIVHLANRQSKNYSNNKTVPAFVIQYIPSLQKYKDKHPENFKTHIREILLARFEDNAHALIDKALEIDQKVLILLHQYYSFPKSAIVDTPLHVCLFDFSHDMSEVYLCYRVTQNSTWDLPFTVDTFFMYFAVEGEGNSFGEFI